MHQHDIIRKQHGYSGLSYLDSLHQCRRHGDAQDKNSTKYAYNQISINIWQKHFKMLLSKTHQWQLFSQFQDVVALFLTTGLTLGRGPELGAATRTRTAWREAAPRAARVTATPGTGERGGVTCDHPHIVWSPVTRSSSRDCPPQLPPRDNGIYSGQSGLWSTGTDSQARAQTGNKKEKKKTGDDPYYFGLSARIPNFVKSRKKKLKERNRANPGQVLSTI